MIEKTLRELEERIATAAATPEDGDALRELVQELRAELGEMEPGLAETARRAVMETADDAQDAIDERLLELETAHPRVAGLIRSLMQTLSDAGI